MSSYCANNPEKCDEYADELFGSEEKQVEFADLTDEQKKLICEHCDSEREYQWDREYDMYKDRDLN